MEYITKTTQQLIAEKLGWTSCGQHYPGIYAFTKEVAGGFKHTLVEHSELIKAVSLENNALELLEYNWFNQYTLSDKKAIELSSKYIN